MIDKYILAELESNIDKVSDISTKEIHTIRFDN